MEENIRGNLLAFLLLKAREEVRDEWEREKKNQCVFGEKRER